ncbi:condensin-2 complex subunit D3-L-like [Glandiceps talaboti]
MADSVRTTEALQNLRLAELPADFVEAAWESEFLENEALPPELGQDVKDNNYFVAYLERVLSTLTPWARSGRDSIPQEFWNAITESGVSHRTLVAFLHYFINCSSRSTVYHREAGALSANIYFVLVSIPGSVGHRIFHPVLFQRAVDILKLWPDSVGVGKRKSKNDPKPSRQGGKGRKKPRKGSDEDYVEDNDGGFGGDSGDDEDDDDGPLVLRPQEIIRIKHRLLDLIKELIRFLKSFSLKESDQEKEHMIQVLVELTKIDVELMEPVFDSDSDLRNINCISQLAHIALCTCVNRLHGEVQDGLHQVFVRLQPSIMMLMGENGAVAATTIPRHIQTIKDNAVAFVIHMIESKGEVAWRPAHILLQKVSWKVPDKAEYRKKVSTAISAILEKFPVSGYARFIEWLVKFSKQIKTGHRMCSLEITEALLQMPTRQPDENTSPEVTVCLSHQFLLQNIIISRCSDRSAVVRAKALSCLAHCATSTDTDMQQVFKELCCSVSCTPTVTPASAIRQKQVINVNGVQFNDQVTPNVGKDKQVNLVTPDIQGITPGNQGVTPGNQGTPYLCVNLTPDSMEKSQTATKAILSMLRRRANDEKTGVRKSAIQAMEHIICLDLTNINKDYMQTIRIRCQDTALSVRKQAMLSLTALLLAKPESDMLQSLWLDGVVPMVTDRETTCQDKCLEMIEEVLLGNIVLLERTATPHHKMVWDIMNKVANDEGEEYRYFLQKGCQQWSKQGKLTPRLMKLLISHANSSHGPGAWILLSMIARHCPKMDQSFIHTCWEDFQAGNADITSSTLVHVVNVIGYTAKHLGNDLVNKFIRDFKKLLKNFMATPDVIQAVIDALCQLCNTQDDGSTVINTWSVDLMSTCDTYLSSVLFTENPTSNIDETKLGSYLFTLGGLIQLAPDKVPKRIKTLVLSILAGPKIAASIQSSQQTQSSQATQSGQILLSQLQNSNLSDRVQAFALNTLGKMCLVDESLAKRTIALLAKELEDSTSPSIRNNAVIIMCDLCVRYPSLVDRYITSIAACVKDENPLVRKQTLTQLTRLLQEDYIKWKGVLFFRFISSLVDPITEIKQFGEFCLGTFLGNRHPLMFFNHFVECLFYFNEYSKHSVFNKFSQSEREKKLFSLKGKGNAAKRMVIYRFLLDQMSDEHRFQLTAKLCQEILGGVVENVIPYDEDSCDLLKDALTVLASKEIKLKSLKRKPTDDAEDGDMDMAGAAEHKIKTAVISLAVKKNVIENIVPIIISLKHMLEKHRSPVLKELMLYLAEVMKDYKNEVKDILAADRQLASEIEFDLRKFEEEEKEKKEKARRRPSLMSPRPASAAGSPKIGCTPPSLPRPTSAPIPAVQGTPLSAGSRNMSLATFALHNSAKRIVEEVKKRRSKSMSDIRDIHTPRTPRPFPTPTSSHTPVNVTPRNRRENVQGKQEEKVASDVESEKNTPTKRTSQLSDKQTPERRPNRTPDGVSRAISTPDRTIANITFQTDNTMTVPPSPIPSSLPMTVFSDVNPRDVPGTASFLPQLQSDEEDNPVGKKKDIICMFSPDHPTPKPRTWKVTPKVTHKKVLTEANGLPSTDDGSPVENTAGEPSVLSERRQTRSRRSRKKDTGQVS